MSINQELVFKQLCGLGVRTEEARHFVLSAPLFAITSVVIEIKRLEGIYFVLNDSLPEEVEIEREPEYLAQVAHIIDLYNDMAALHL